MVIAVNTRFLLTGYLEGYGYFIYESFKRIVKNNPQHQFVFIFDRPHNEQFVFAPNITSVIAGPPARHPLLWKLWYDIKVPAILRKVKADVFVSCDGFCSLHTKVPQCLVVHDLSFLHFPSFIKKSHLLYYRRNTPKFLAKASRVATVSEFSKRDIEKTYHIVTGKTEVVYSAAKEIFKPVTAAVKIEAKEKYTAGKEYFLYTGSIHPRKNLMNLLKAFSLFKKRQQTGMKLVLAGRLAWKYESFTKSLETYKYRNDVVLTGYIEEQELSRLTGAAYAMVYPSLFEGFGVPVLEAMQCGVPVITSSDTSMQEIAKEAALYAAPGDINEIAEKMMLIYKDENLKKQLTEKGKLVAAQYSWDKTAELLWDSILKASNK